MSKTTKKANAMFTGFGKTKRILLGDTLLNNFTNEEIVTVIAHELGHYKYKHILKNLIIGTFLSFFTLFCISEMYIILLPYLGYHSITEISALPLLVVIGMITGILFSPLSAGISKKFEFQADRFAVSVTGKHDIYIQTLNKLNEQNLGDRDPNVFVEWFFYSHPSISNRIKAIEKLK